jgi:hypothetical protein
MVMIRDGRSQRLEKYSMICRRLIFLKINLIKEWLRAHSLTKEVIFILVLKVGLLSLIWWMFFSHPMDESVRLKTVTKMLLTPKE